MAAFANASSWALMAVTKAARKLQGLCPNVLGRCLVADEERAEPGIDLEPMEGTGVRQRRVPEPTPGTADDNIESPTTTPTTTSTSGTFTPGTSEDLSDNPGRASFQVDPRYRSAKANNVPQDAFIKAAWQRLSGRLGGRWSSRMSDEEKKKWGYDKLIDEKCE